MCRPATLGRVARGATLFAVLAALATPALAQSQQNGNAGKSDDLNKMSQNPNNWVMAQHDYANTRYSKLDQINTKNIKNLQVAWTFSVGADRGQEAAPLVINGTMYVVGPYIGTHPNEVFALDAATGDLKWSYTPKPDLSAVGVACCDVVNRGLAYDNGKIFLNTLDDYSVAIDAKTGKELWHTKLGDINKGETITMAPLVVHGKVLIGNSGGELGVRGWLTAVDENTGKIAWRAWSTGPDKDVLIGKNFHPYYKWMQGKNLGVTTWPPGGWKIGGSTVWGWLQYDPTLNLLYYGTANPGTWNQAQRPGDNLWSTSIFARNPDNGQAAWAYQMTPHDWFDYDEINESILLNLPINGKKEKVLVHPGRNGYMYVINRETGQVYSATKYGVVNATKKIDLKTGRPVKNEALKPTVGKTIVDVCPASPGVKDWQPTAYSPKTGYIYVPHQNLCMNFKTRDVAYIAGTPYIGATVDMYAAPGDGHRGVFEAWDPIKKKAIWSIEEKFPVWTGTVATAGDLVFYGTMDRWFKAVNAKTGEVVWKFHMPSGMIGQPITYAVNGTQYVAILCGIGGWPAVDANAEVDPRVRNGALGFTGATQDVVKYTSAGGTLMVFALSNKLQHTVSEQPVQNPAVNGAAQPHNQPNTNGANSNGSNNANQ